MSLRVLSLLAIAAKVFVGVSAQATSNATCLPEYNWMSNSKGQNPCLVASYLQSACNNGDWSVVDLPPDTHYTGPTLDEVNSCQCSTVTYSMISACGICQNRTAEGWDAWSFNCTSEIYPEVFLDNIPSGTAVPAWAYLNVTAENVFNPSEAEAEAETNPPESTGTSAPTASASSSPIGPPSSGSNKSSNAGAIAGGIVGGLVGLGLVAGAIAIFLVRRRRAYRAPSASFGIYGNGANPIRSPPPMSQEYRHPVYGDGVQTSLKLYNPSDPSTHPSSPPAPTIHTTDSGLLPQGQPGRLGQYNFVPEV